MKLVNEATNAVTSRKEKEPGRAGKSEGSNSAENQFIRAIIDLHDKYMQVGPLGVF